MATEDADRGVYDKFKVTRHDKKHRKGRKHHNCQYFVLDLTHDPYARQALRAYARACKTTHPQLSQDLMNALLYDPPSLAI